MNNFKRRHLWGLLIGLAIGFLSALFKEQGNLSLVIISTPITFPSILFFKAVGQIEILRENFVFISAIAGGVLGLLSSLCKRWWIIPILYLLPGILFIILFVKDGGYGSF